MTSTAFMKKLYSLKTEIGQLRATQLSEAIEALHAHQFTDVAWDQASQSDSSSTANPLNRDAFNDMCQRQHALIDDVIECHRLEVSEGMETFLVANTSVKTLDFNQQDGTSGHRFYAFDGRRGPCYIVGDLHGDGVALKKIIEICGLYEWPQSSDSQPKLIFLGDYLDRGKRQIELLERLMVLKLLFPKFVFLQRGNHDSAVLEDGDFKLALRKPEEEPESDYLLLLAKRWSADPTLKADQLHLKYFDLFKSLCVVGFLKLEDSIVMLSHGGIIRPSANEGDHSPQAYFPTLTSLSVLTDDTHLDDIGRTRIHNLMWSDPTENPVDLAKETGRFKFTKAHFEAFSELTGIDALIRGHQVFNEGIKSFFDGKLVSVFSSGTSPGTDNPDTAYANVTPKIIRMERNERTSLTLF